MNWKKLSEVLPPIEREEDITSTDLFEIGSTSKIHLKKSKAVLFKSKYFERLCKESYIGENGFKSDFLIGYVTIEDVIEGKSGNEDDDHRVVVSIIGMDNIFAIKGADDSKLYKNVFGEDDDIEWFDMDAFSAV